MIFRKIFRVAKHTLRKSTRLTERARWALRKGDPEAAIAHCRAALAIDPELYSARINLARALLKVERLEEAEPVLFALTDTHPDRAEPLIELARLALLNGDPEAAIGHCRAALKIDAGLYSARITLARALKKHGQWRDSIDVLQALSREHPKRSDLYLEIGRLFKSAGELEVATKWFRKVLAEDPTNPEATLDLARYYRLKGDLSTHSATLTRIDTERLKQTKAIVRHAIQQNTAENYDISLRLWKRAREREPDSCAILTELASTSLGRAISRPLFKSRSRLSSITTLPSGHRTLLVKYP